MKNLAIFGLAAAAYTMAAPSLWHMKIDSWQVQTPERLACDQSIYDAQEDYGHCYELSAGWWFAYEGGGTVSFDSPVYKDEEGKYKLVTSEEGKIVKGGNLQEGVGLVVGWSATGGTDKAPATAGIGFNWTKAENGEIDISAHGGYCLAYNWTGSESIQVELGWDDNKHPDYDTFFAELPPGSKSLDLPWSAFDKQGYAKADPTTIDDATKKAVSMKIRTSLKTESGDRGVLTVSELGWVGECSGAGATGGTTGGSTGGNTTPGAGGDAIVSFDVASAKVLVSGRTLSLAGISSASVEVVNLRGQVVASQKMNSSAAMNLSSLDAGIYMVRVQGKSVNYAQKVILK